MLFSPTAAPPRQLFYLLVQTSAHFQHSPQEVTVIPVLFPSSHKSPLLFFFLFPNLFLTRLSRKSTSSESSDTSGNGPGKERGGAKIKLHLWGYWVGINLFNKIFSSLKKKEKKKLYPKMTCIDLFHWYLFWDVKYPYRPCKHFMFIKSRPGFERIVKHCCSDVINHRVRKNKKHREGENIKVKASGIYKGVLKRESSSFSFLILGVKWQFSWGEGLDQSTALVLWTQGGTSWW